MVWTDELPDRADWYWWRKSPKHPETVRIVSMLGGRLMVEIDGQYYIAANHGGQWCRIPRPEEPRGA